MRSPMAIFYKEAVPGCLEVAVSSATELWVVSSTFLR